VLAVAAVWGGVRVVGVIQGSQEPSAVVPAVLGRLPAFTLTERSGRPVTLADLRGSVWVATFFFSRCQDTCPLQVARLVALGAEFREAPQLRLVAITVDPSHDTPGVLTDYARRLGLDRERALLLTGDRATIADLARRGFLLAVGEVAGPDVSGGVLVAHSDRLALVDGDGQLRGTYESRDPEALGRLHDDLTRLLRDSRAARAAS
jgi:cytochrome oxidase Cu insertion factor (SCO1/SenC/PrrC family)